MKGHYLVLLILLDVHFELLIAIFAVLSDFRLDSLVTILLVLALEANQFPGVAHSNAHN